MRASARARVHLFASTDVSIEFVDLREESLEAGVRRADGRDGRHQLHRLVGHVLVLKRREGEREHGQTPGRANQPELLAGWSRALPGAAGGRTFLAACRLSFSSSWYSSPDAAISPLAYRASFSNMSVRSGATSTPSEPHERERERERRQTDRARVSRANNRHHAE